VLSAQVCWPPALIAVKRVLPATARGVAVAVTGVVKGPKPSWPSRLEPQQ